MPEYLSPGVYVEEFEIGARPIEGVSTSTAGFLGETERGSTIPRMVTSWPDYQRKYGSYFGVGKYMPYAVQGFFDNGGKRCFIGRIVKAGDSPATNATSELADNLIIEAVGEGSWGNRISLIVGEGTFTTDEEPLFSLKVNYWKVNAPDKGDLVDPFPDSDSPDFDAARNQKPPTVSEIYDDLSTNEESSNYYKKRVNGISNLIRIVEVVEDDPVGLPQPAEIAYLENGFDGDGTIILSDYKRVDTDKLKQGKGLTGFKKIDEISIIYSPNASKVNGLNGALITHCEKLKDRFAVIDSELGKPDVSVLDPRSKRPTEYAAFYYPWIKVVDPEVGRLRTIPPGGHAIGIYARSDTERGVHKAPANEVVRGVKELEFQITTEQQDILNPRGVNVIRAFKGRGIRVWGARTLSSNTLWKYINVRRLFIFMEESIDEGTQWVVFEPNDRKLWGRVISTITQFLTGVWRSGALFGSTAEEAFFVKCDESTMTQDDIDNGRLICVIGVAPVKPAEFVIFRITQFSGSAESAIAEL